MIVGNTVRDGLHDGIPVHQGAAPLIRLEDSAHPVDGPNTIRE